ATGEYGGLWQKVAKQHWNLGYANVPAVLKDCLQATDKWIRIGALLSGQTRVSGQTRASALGQTWREQVKHIANTADDADVGETARRFLGEEVEERRPSLSLTDTMLFLKRI